MWGELRGSSAVAAPQRSSMADGTARDVYDVGHPRPWGFKVSSYLWTKSIAAGALGLAAPLALAHGLVEPFGLTAALIALVFVAVTAVLLIVDLKRPERFWYILAKPNFRSWLVWGAYILSVFGAVATAWALVSVLGLTPLLLPLAVLGILFGVAAAGYSGLLFGQAEGRDFWQSPLLPLHLVVQAGIAGAAVLAIAAVFLGTTEILATIAGILIAALLAHVLLIAAELFTPHANTDVEQAAHAMTHGPDARLFWLGAMIVGIALPLVALGAAALGAAPVVGTTAAALAALGGLLAYEDSWIRAGQAVPLS